MDSATLTQQLQQATQNAPDALTLYNQAVQKYGVPEIRSNVAGLRTTLANTQSAIDNVAPSVAARSQGSLVTGGQQSALAGLERQPLDKAYASESSSLNNANTDLNSLLSQAGTEADLGYKSSQDKIGNLKDLLSAATQKEQNAAQAAEAQREFNISQSSKSSGSSSKSSSSAPPPINTGLAQLFSGYVPANKGGQAFYTEKNIIPQIESAYGLSPTEAAKVVYAYRKSQFGE